jgi:branched-chain amino acid aminotransferase group I
MQQILYLNGSLMPRSQADLSPNDWGFLYGYGLFETMRAYSGHLFRPEQHLARLLHSAQLLGLNFPPENQRFSDLEEALYETLQANNLKDARLRLTISGGVGEMSPYLSPCRASTVLITAQSYTPYPSQVYERGFKAITSHIRRNSGSPTSQIKSTSYLDSLLARREAEVAGNNEAILLNEQGFLAEGSMSNLFLISGGVVFTPDKDSGILPGITRQAVLELALSLCLEAIERRITLEELLRADEAFFTNSLVEIMPLSQVDGQNIGLGKAGAITKKLAQAYCDLVQEELMP